MSTQIEAALLRLRLPLEESRMDFTMDCPVLRLWEETEMADWMIWREVGLGGRGEDCVREVSQGCGKRVDWHASRI